MSHDKVKKAKSSKCMKWHEMAWKMDQVDKRVEGNLCLYKTDFDAEYSKDVNMKHPVTADSHCSNSNTSTTTKKSVQTIKKKTEAIRKQKLFLTRHIQVLVPEVVLIYWDQDLLTLLFITLRVCLCAWTAHHRNLCFSFHIENMSTCHNNQVSFFFLFSVKLHHATLFQSTVGQHHPPTCVQTESPQRLILLRSITCHMKKKFSRITFTSTLIRKRVLRSQGKLNSPADNHHLDEDVRKAERVTSTTHSTCDSPNEHSCCWPTASRSLQPQLCCKFTYLHKLRHTPMHFPLQAFSIYCKGLIINWFIMSFIGMAVV